MMLRLWAEHILGPQRTNGSGMRVQLPVSLNMGPLTVECIYMFYFVTCFFLLAFHLIFLLFLWNKHLPQCVCVCERMIGSDCLHLYKYLHFLRWIKPCLILQIRPETHCCRCTESCFQVVNANVLIKSCYELMRMYLLYFCVFLWLTSQSLPQPFTLVAH